MIEKRADAVVIGGGSAGLAAACRIAAEGHSVVVVEREDQLGGLDLTISGLRERDDLLLEEAASRGIGVAVTLAGGYAIRPDHTVEIHCGSVRAAAALASTA